MSSNTKNIPVHAIKTKEMGSSGFGFIQLDGSGGREYDSSTPHRHAFFELIFFIAAEGNHEIDFHNYPVQSHSVHVVSPGQIHKLSLRKNKGYVLCFTEDFSSLKSKGRFVENFPFYDTSAHPILHLPKLLSEQMESLFAAIQTELQTGNAESLDVCRSYLQIILLKLKSFFSETAASQTAPGREKHPKVALFKRNINTNYLAHKTVSDYASDLAISPNHLNALCKKEEGKTATQFIQERILLEAKRLLYATDMHIKEISFYLQFEDVPYFNRFFKKQTGLRPNEYRNKLKKH